MRWCIKKNKRFSFPRIFKKFRLNPISVHGTFRFTFESLYEMDDYPQWNKLIGITTGFIPNKNSVMIAWRCVKNRIEVVPYYNDADGKIIVNNDDIIKVDLEESYGFSIYPDTIRIGTQLFKSPVIIKGRVYSTISPYFGGKRKAPSEVAGYLKIVIN